MQKRRGGSPAALRSVSLTKFSRCGGHPDRSGQGDPGIRILAASVMLRQSGQPPTCVYLLRQSRLSDVSLHSKANTSTAKSVMLRQHLRPSVVRSLHPEATAFTASSVMLRQLFKLSVVSCLHPEATATTAASVISSHHSRLSDASWEQFKTNAATNASSTVRAHL